MANAVHQLAEFGGLQAGQVIRAFHVAIQGNVAFHQPGTQSYGTEGNGDTALMAGVTDQAMQLLQAAQVAELDIHLRRRVGAVAVQQRERRAQRVELFDCTDDFVLEGHAGRQDQRLAQAGSLGDQVGVAQIGRSNFQGRHIERRQGLDARLIPRGAQVGNALLRTIGAHLAVLVEAQLDLV
ncbi:hypothetical protein D3C80_1608550 [compost metagenome]